jgi:hypothetical protein
MSTVLVGNRVTHASHGPGRHLSEDWFAVARSVLVGFPPGFRLWLADRFWLPGRPGLVPSTRARATSSTGRAPDF